MKKHTSRINRTINLIFFIFTIFFITGCSVSELKTPTTPNSKFAQSYKGISPNNSTIRAITPCIKSEVIKLESSQFSYDEVVEDEYRMGNVEVGHSTLRGELISTVQSQIQSFANSIGACRAYWVMEDTVDLTTNRKSTYYGVSYFAKIDRSLIAGFHPGEPSNEKKEEMGRHYGVEVRAIMPETAADTMGLIDKDIILFINHQRCTYSEYTKNTCGVNSKWHTVRVYREGKIIDIRN